jgi:hypothetical protein
MTTARQPICIWTTSGWKCISSPLKVHYPGSKACKVLPPERGVPTAITKPVEKLVRGLLRGAGLHGADPEVIAKVVGLMVVAQVGKNTPFTIIRAR